MIAGVAGRLGLDGALVRFMAEFKSKKQFGTLRRVYRKSMVASGVLSVMLGAALYLLAPELAARLATGTESLEQAFRVTAFLIPPFVWLGMNTESAAGAQAYDGLLVAAVRIHCAVGGFGDPFDT